MPKSKKNQNHQDKNYLSYKNATNENDEHEYENDGNDEAADKEKESGQEFQNIVHSGSVVTKSDDIVIHSLTIIGQIEGHYAMAPQNKTTKYEHIIPLLVAIEENPEIHGLLILINTVGGDVEAGLAIAEMIASMKKPTCSLVLGGGHSIGVPLAVCTNVSYIVPSATMTVHPVRMNGLVIGVEQSYNYFSRMQERINKFIIKHSKLSDKKLNELMFNTGELSTDVGTIIDGETAVNLGLIDKIGGLKDALVSLKIIIKNNKKSVENSAAKPKRKTAKAAKVNDAGM